MTTERAILWTEHTRDEFPGLAERGAVVVVPIGSVEQHGEHMPVDTDCRTVGHVALRAAAMVEEAPVLVTPTIPFGISPHHMVFPGTITLRVGTLLTVLGDVCESIVAHGFDRILILSGHGGNAGTISAAALELRHRLDREIVAHNWFDLPAVIDAMDAVRQGPGHSIGHSGELECSTILALTPDAVRREALRVVPGVSDDPALADAAKGEHILRAASEAVAEVLRRMAAMPGRQVVGIETIRA